MQLPSLFGEYSHVSPNFLHGRGGDFCPSLKEAAGPAVYVPGNSPFGEFRTTQVIPNATPTAPTPKMKRRLLFARAISRRVSSPSGFCLSSCTLPGWSVPQHVSAYGMYSLARRSTITARSDSATCLLDLSVPQPLSGSRYTSFVSSTHPTDSSSTRSPPRAVATCQPSPLRLHTSMRFSSCDTRTT